MARGRKKKERYINHECLNYNEEAKGCKVTTNIECPRTCGFYVDDIDKYLNTILGMWRRYKSMARSDNSAYYKYLYEAEVELVDFCEKYGLDVPGEVYGFGKMDGLWAVYKQEMSRGGKGGGGSESDSNNKTSAKQKMKDNRDRDTKMNKEERKELSEALKEWEDENGKLDKLSRSPMGRSKVDSYTGEPIQ